MSNVKVQNPNEPLNAKDQIFEIWILSFEILSGVDILI